MKPPLGTFLGVREELAPSGAAGHCVQHLHMYKLQIRKCGKCTSAWCQKPWFRLCDLGRVTQPLWAQALDMGCRVLSALHAGSVGLQLSNPAGSSG